MTRKTITNSSNIDYSLTHIMDDVSQVSSGSYSVMAVTTDGSIFAWGNHLYDGVTENLTVAKSQMKILENNRFTELEKNELYKLLGSITGKWIDEAYYTAEVIVESVAYPLEIILAYTE